MSFIKFASVLCWIAILTAATDASAQIVLLDARDAIDARTKRPQSLEARAAATLEAHLNEPNYVRVLVVQLNSKALGERRLKITLPEGVSQTFEKRELVEKTFVDGQVWYGDGGPKDRPLSRDQARLYLRDGKISGEFEIGDRAFLVTPIGSGRSILSEYGEKFKQPAPHPIPQQFLRKTLPPSNGSLPVPQSNDDAGSERSPGIVAPVSNSSLGKPSKNDGVLPTLPDESIANGLGVVNTQVVMNSGLLPVPDMRRDSGAAIAPAIDYSEGVNIVFAVTPKVFASRGNDAKFVSDLVAEINQIMASNGVSVRFNSVGVVSFPDYQSIGIAVERVIGNADVSRARNENNADIVIVLGSYSEGCIGLSEVYPPASRAFSVISAGCQNLARATAHEIGHVMGGRHDTDRDGGSSPFLGGHGYIARVHYFPSPNAAPAVECVRSIMADQPPSTGCSRHVWTSIWSDPASKAGDLYRQEPSGWWAPIQSVYFGNVAANMKSILQTTTPRTRSLRLEKWAGSWFDAVYLFLSGLLE